MASYLRDWSLKNELIYMETDVDFFAFFNFQSFLFTLYAVIANILHIHFIIHN